MSKVSAEACECICVLRRCMLLVSSELGRCMRAKAFVSCSLTGPNNSPERARGVGERVAAVNCQHFLQLVRERSRSCRPSQWPLNLTSAGVQMTSMSLVQSNIIIYLLRRCMSGGSCGSKACRCLSQGFCQSSRSTILSNFRHFYDMFDRSAAGFELAVRSIERVGKFLQRHFSEQKIVPNAST